MHHVVEATQRQNCVVLMICSSSDPQGGPAVNSQCT